VAKYLTYEDLIILALKHYNFGGDGIYECWDEKTFNEYVKEFGPITKEKAFQLFKTNLEIDNEYFAAAHYFSSEN
jgi:hypothetical protein